MTLEACFSQLGWTSLCQWLAQRELPFLFERSLRLETDVVEDRRALVSVPCAALGKQGGDEVLQICRLMSSPEGHLAAIARFFPQAGHVHFGFEVAGSTRIGKCYLELQATDSGSHLQFVGFKWSMTDDSVAVVSRYRSIDIQSRQQVSHAMLANVGGDWKDTACDLLNAVIPARNNDAAEQLRLLEVTEEGSNRQSYDLNVYERDLNVAAVSEYLRVFCEKWNCPEADLEAWLKQQRNATLGHLAMGQTRNDRPFLTVYHSAKLDTISQP